MKESTMQTAFTKWIKYEANEFFLGESVSFELKIEKTHRFSFAKVKDHQIKGLRQSKTGMAHKISDSPIFSGQKTRFTAAKPFDCMYLKAKEAYVVVWFYVPRKPKIFYLIEVEVFELMKVFHDKKSVTVEDIEKYRDIYSDIHAIEMTEYFRAKKK